LRFATQNENRRCRPCRWWDLSTDEPALGGSSQRGEGARVDAVARARKTFADASIDQQRGAALTVVTPL